MPRFMPFPGLGPKPCLAYHQVPADIIEDAEALRIWARKSVAVALASQAAKARAESSCEIASQGEAKKAREEAAESKARARPPLVVRLHDAPARCA